MTETILVDRSGPVAAITFNRPERHNAFNTTLIREVVAELRSIAADPAVRVVLLRGAGRSFSAGADLEEMLDQGSLGARRVALQWIEMFELLETIPQPVVASVHGHAIAGGTELTLACDLVIAADDSRFGLTEAQVGVIPGAGASARLSRWVGRAAAKQILMLGEVFPAQEAHRLGLVNWLVPRDELESATEALCAKLASRSPIALAAVKRVVDRTTEMELRGAIQYALQEFALVFAGPDQREGMAAFLEKRAPQFTGFAAAPPAAAAPAAAPSTPSQETAP